jgi:hypothetical protein
LVKFSNDERNNVQKRALKFMPKKPKLQAVKTPVEAQQAEPGASLLMLVMIVLGLAVIIVACIRFVFLHF